MLSPEVLVGEPKSQEVCVCVCGGGGWRDGGGGKLHLTLHCHHQNDFCIKMGIDESYFNGFSRHITGHDR